jgi:hypothetical protein
VTAVATTAPPEDSEIVFEPVKTPKPADTRTKRAGRKSNVERLEAQKREAELARQIKAEGKRATRLQPDTRGALGVALGIAVVNLATAGAISYATLVAVAGWMRLPWEPLAWVVPGFIELLIVFSTLDYLISRSRGESARAPFWAMVAFSAIAVVANGAHTVGEWGADFDWRAAIGTVLAATAPLVVIYTSKRLAALVFVGKED